MLSNKVFSINNLLPLLALNLTNREVILSEWRYYILPLVICSISIQKISTSINLHIQTIYIQLKITSLLDYFRFWPTVVFFFVFLFAKALYDKTQPLSKKYHS